jgi:LysR family tcuABC transcriptional regulator
MRQLRYFVQIVESGSLAKASRQLYVAQPALSQQVAKLENEVGKTLLVRSSKGVTPSENGQALYHHAKFMLRQLEQALSIARQEPSEVRGMVSVGLAPTTLSALGLPLVRHVREKYPGIVLNVVEGMSGHLEQMTRLAQLDLAILFRQSAASEMVAEPLLEEELFVMFPARDPLVPANRKRLALAEVARLPMILPTSSHGLRRRISQEFERLGLALDLKAEIDSLHLLMSCVYEGMGATIQPMAATYALGTQRSEWRFLPISDVSLSRQNFLYSLGPDKLSPCAAMLKQELRDVVSTLAREGRWTGISLARE